MGINMGMNTCTNTKLQTTCITHNILIDHNLLRIDIVILGCDDYKIGMIQTMTFSYKVQ